MISIEPLVSSTYSLEWHRVAARFLAQPEEAGRRRLWPLILMRGFPFGLVEPPPSTIETYRRTWWLKDAPVGEAEYDLTAEIAWSSKSGASIEVAIVNRAFADGMEIAGNVVVLRSDELESEDIGERRVPKMPPLPKLEPDRRFVPDPERFDLLEALVGRRSKVTGSDRFAHGQGFPSALTPSLVLLYQAFDDSGPEWRSTGTVEMWLPSPIQRGAVTEICRSDQDRTIAMLRMIGRESPASVCRMLPTAMPY